VVEAEGYSHGQFREKEFDDAARLMFRIGYDSLSKMSVSQ